MSTAETLFSNLLVFFILFSLALIVYCKIKNQTIGDVLREIKEATTDE